MTSPPYRSAARRQVVEIFLLIAALVAAAEPIPMTLQHPQAARPATGNGASGAGVFSGQDRYLFFLSEASNLVTNDFNGSVIDVFRRDLIAGQTELVSLATTGRPGSRPVTDFYAFPDGQRLLFVSASDDPAAGDTNHTEDLYVRDLTQGITRLLSISRLSAGAGNGPSSGPSVSADGRFLAFESQASDLAEGIDTNGVADVFLMDLLTGDTCLVSRSENGQSGNAASWSPEISSDGSIVAFRSRATDLAPSSMIPTELFIYRTDGQSLEQVALPEDIDPRRTSLVEVEGVVVSPDSKKLAFHVLLLNPGSPALQGVWWKDLESGAVVKASADAAVFGDELAFSPDSRRLAFSIRVGDEPGATNQIRIWSPERGMQSLGDLQAPGSTGAAPPSSSWAPLFSPDGAAILYLSDAPASETEMEEHDVVRLFHREFATGVTRLLANDAAFGGRSFDSTGARVVADLESKVGLNGDDNATLDVQIIPLAGGESVLVSAAQPTTGRRAASGASVSRGGSSDDGRWWGFLSYADDLTAHDRNRSTDGFVFDQTSRLVSPVGAKSNQEPLPGRTSDLQLSAPGRLMAIATASALDPNYDTNTFTDIYVQDLSSQELHLISARNGEPHSLDAEAYAPRISADGRWAAFRASTGFSLAHAGLYLRDLSQRRTWRLDDELTMGGLPYFAPYFFSADGQTALFVGQVHSFVYQHREHQPNHSGSARRIFTREAWLSGDGRLLFYNLDGSESDTPPGFYEQQLADVSPPRRLGPTLTRYADLIISADGSIIAFSQLGEPVTAQARAMWQVVVVATATGQSEIISVSTLGRPGNADSRHPVLSADGRFVAFRSDADDLAADDDNGQTDVFVRDRYTGATWLMSRNAAGKPARGRSSRPELSANGRCLSFTTFARELVPHDENGLGDLALVEVPHPNAADQDGDGSADAWELDHFGSRELDSADDSDGDGMTNLQESRARTRPNDGGSRLDALARRESDGSVFLTWAAHVGVSYQAERRDSLETAETWIAVGEPTAGYEGPIHLRLPERGAAQFFRISVR